MLAGLPFLPQACVWRPHHGLNAQLTSFAVSALDITDVVVSKLKRFNANDANDVHSHGAGATDLPDYVDNLHRVERDFFGVEETEIDLPAWCER